MHHSIVIGALCGIAVLADVVHGDSISYSDLTPGSQVATGLLADGSASVSAYGDYSMATPGKFSTFSVLGQDPIAGVGGPLRTGDLLVSGPEAIIFDFGRAVLVDRLDVAFLYQGAPPLPDETAKFTVKYGDNTTGSFVLSPISPRTASYAGAAPSVSSGDPGIVRIWGLADPFGEGRSVTQLVLEAGPNSNIGFRELRVTPVPLPAPVWGGLALMGAMGANTARKRWLAA